MSKISDFIHSKIGPGTVLTIAYSGGSRPGMPRELVPIACTETELEAVEPGSRIKKRYKMDKVIWASIGDVKIVNDCTGESQETIFQYESISSFAEEYRDTLAALGWHIHEEEEFFGVGGYFKNGKPRKTASVAIAFYDRSTEEVFDETINDFVEVKRELTGRERPWRVDSWRFREGKTFSSLPSALQLFLQEVRDSDPENSKGMFAGH